jgi:Uma2 family endonuclease
MRELSEISVPETKPATEWVRGRALQKMSPKPWHSALQGWLNGWLHAWAGRRGFVGTELDIKIGRPGEPLRPLVPDVCYNTFERWSREQFATNEVPRVAPDIVVEILSPDDRRIDLDDKLDVYLQAGTALALVIDPRERTVETVRGRNLAQARNTIYREAEVIALEPFKGLTLALPELFAAIDFSA